MFQSGAQEGLPQSLAQTSPSFAPYPGKFPVPLSGRGWGRGSQSKGCTLSACLSIGGFLGDGDSSHRSTDKQNLIHVLVSEC